MASEYAGIQGTVNFINTNFGLKLSRQDVETPSRELLPSVFITVYRDFGMNENALEQLAFSDYLSKEVDMISPSVHTVHLLKIMRVVFAGLGVPNVSIVDLLNPQPKRIRKLITVLLDNWVTQRSLLTRYDEKEQQHLRTKEEIELLKNKVDIAKSRVNELLIHPGCSSEQRASIQSECNAVADQLHNRNSMGTAKDKEYRDLKHEVTEATSRLDALTCTAQELSLVVQEARRAAAVSPTQLRRQEATAAEEVARCRREAASEAEKLAAVRERVEHEGRAAAVRAEQLMKFSGGLTSLKTLRDCSEQHQCIHRDRVEVEARYHKELKALEAAREESSNGTAQVARERTALLAKLESQRQNNVEVLKKRREAQQRETRLHESRAAREARLQRELGRYEAAAAEAGDGAVRLVAETKSRILGMKAQQQKCEDVFHEKARKIAEQMEGEAAKFGASKDGWPKKP